MWTANSAMKQGSRDYDRLKDGQDVGVGQVYRRLFEMDEAANERKLKMKRQDYLSATEFYTEGFFNIDESFKHWVLRSASKKWKDFKVVLKRTYFNPNILRRQNIRNGCGSRIPDPQWAWLVNHWKSREAHAKSKKNKAIRAMQLNGTHTTGSRSFAVTLDQSEIKEGRQVTRAELYIVTHTKRNGEPVDKYSGDNIKEIKRQFEANLALVCEETCDGDVYSGLFPKEKSGRWRGLGLLVAGSASRDLAEVKAKLQDTKNENVRLWSVVQELMKKQSKLQQQHNELKDMWLASQGHAPANSSPKNGAQPKVTLKDMEEVNNEDKAASLSSRNNKRSELQTEIMEALDNLDKRATLSSRNSKKPEVKTEVSTSN